ncbi:MAG: sugar phosphate isomerase/epimerase [Planctomycetota bacterium]|jgi:sugar phosphate isomerase/epimerase|nr:sugar phosphate isomerase/epimerase [Planctomycetota bacterium]
MIKGPAIFLAQFMGDEAPFNSLDSICKWAAGLGYKGVQLPGWDARCIDLNKAAESKSYCEDVAAVVAKHGLEITEIATHLQGQLVAVHPAYNEMFDAFAPEAVQGNPDARTEWAVQQVKNAATASKHLGLSAVPSFTGALMWHTVYPWPQRPAGLVEGGFKELARRWTPILNHFDSCGVDVAWEVHPGEDVHDGATFEMMLDACNNHARACLLYDPSHFVLQQLDYLHYIDLYHDRIKAFHVKDAEFRPNGRTGVYGGYQGWQDRAGRFRSLGDGQVDFAAIFSLLTKYGFDSWAVLEWECCFKDATQGAAEGAPFIAKHIITPPAKAFDDFAGSGVDEAQIKRTLGI